MKKILLSLLLKLFIIFCFMPTVFGAEKAQIEAPVEIIDGKLAHRDQVRAIVRQDPINLFGLRAAMKMQRPDKRFKTYMAMCEMAEDAMRNNLIDPYRNKITRVMQSDGKVVGFSSCCKEQDTSMAAIERYYSAAGKPFTEATRTFMAMMMPGLKKTDVECREYAKIEMLAVDKATRGRGYGVALVADAVNEVKGRWPGLKSVQLDLEETNGTALRLFCERSGFKKALEQPDMVRMSGKVRLEKSL